MYLFECTYQTMNLIYFLDKTNMIIVVTVTNLIVDRLMIKLYYDLIPVLYVKKFCNSIKNIYDKKQCIFNFICM